MSHVVRLLLIAFKRLMNLTCSYMQTSVYIKCWVTLNLNRLQKDHRINIILPLEVTFIRVCWVSFIPKMNKIPAYINFILIFYELASTQSARVCSAGKELFFFSTGYESPIWHDTGSFSHAVARHMKHDNIFSLKWWGHRHVWMWLSSEVFTVL